MTEVRSGVLSVGLGGLPAQPFENYEDLARVFRTHVAPGKLAYLETFGLNFVLSGRKGIYFENAVTGKRYINCHVNGGTYNLGHVNPRVSEAVRGVLGHIDIGNHHMPSPYRAELARRLSATTGDALSRVVFGVSGGEAIDLAIKAARGKTKRQKVISTVGGYHGHTGLAMAAGDPRYREAFGESPPGYIQVNWDDLEALEAVMDEGVAAVLLESLPATMGMRIPSQGYFKHVRALCDRYGACLILDEVQSGLGRAGRMWSYEYDDVVPDAVVTGKGLSGGIYPITATLLCPELHEPLNRDPFVHISTFGGAEIGCVAALEVLDIVEEPGFLERVTELGERFEIAFADLPFSLRRRGLFMGLHFEDEGSALSAMVAMLNEGVFPFPAGNDPTTLQFLPPLIITDAEADDLIGRVCRALC